MAEMISASEARRVALVAQGFGPARPRQTRRSHLRQVIDRLHLLQIDSVNVVTRAHYFPAFSRIGEYDRAWLEEDAWGPAPKRRLFEYWAHEASILPLDLQPLLRWRMARAQRGEIGYKASRHFASERRAEADAILARIGSEGPLTAADFKNGSSRSGWWDWRAAKHALEYLFWAGRISTAARLNTFARVYDLTERVIPPAVLELPTPDPPVAQQALIERSARALGIATSAELRDYFRLAPAEAHQAIADLAEAGTLTPVRVEGWSNQAWLHRDARFPQKSARQAY